MSFPIALPVKTLCITHVQWLKRLLQAIIGGGHGNQVNMVGHQTIGQYFNLMLVGVFLQPRQINEAILVTEENRLAPIATLSYVVGKPGKHGSG